MPDDSFARQTRYESVRVETVAVPSGVRPVRPDWSRALPGILAGPRGWVVALAATLATAWLLRLGLGLVLPRYHHPDELFQYYEQAHRIAFGSGVVPWEYRDGIRSWLLPGILAGLMKLSAPIGGSVTYFALSKALWSTVSLGVVAVAFLWGRHAAGLLAGLVGAAIAAIWFELVYFGPAALTESIGAAALFAGAYLLTTAESEDRRRLFWAGLLLGTAFAFRFHLGPALLVAAIVGCRGDGRRWGRAIVGAAIPILALALLDWLTLGWPLQSVFKNFWINIVEERSHNYGVMPLWFYVTEYLDVWRWWSVPLVLLAVWGAFGRDADGRRTLSRSTMLWAVPLAVVLSHSLVAHKEYRFVLPALPFILTLAAIGSARLARFVAQRTELSLPAAAVAIVTAWGIASVALASSPRFAGEWFRAGPSIAADASLQDRADLCGLGVLASWGDFAGYVGLNRDVPVIWSPDLATMAAERDAYNYALAPAASPPPAHWGYVVEECWGNGSICIYGRAGSCSPPGPHSMNETMKGIGD